MSVPLSNKSSHFSFVNRFLHGITEFLGLFNQPCLINKWQTCVKAIFIAFTYICWFFWLHFLFKYIWCLIKEYFESVCCPFTNWLSIGDGKRLWTVIYETVYFFLEWFYIYSSYFVIVLHFLSLCRWNGSVLVEGNPFLFTQVVIYQNFVQ